MAAIDGIHAYLEANYDAGRNRVAIGTCKCKPYTTVYIFNVDQPTASMTVGCSKKSHLWNQVKKADILYNLHDKKSTPPAMSRVKDTIQAWKSIIPDNLEQDGLEQGQQMTKVITKIIPIKHQAKSDFVGGMQGLSNSASEEGLIIQDPEDAEEGSGQRKGASESGDDEKSSELLAADDADEEFTVGDRKQPAAEDNNAWIFFLVDSMNGAAKSTAAAVKSTAAAVAHLGHLIAQHGIPQGVNGLMFLDAWNTGDPLRFARALEPAALKLWPQHWIDQHIMMPAFFKVLRFMITTDASLQQMRLLQKMVQQTKVPVQPAITPPDVENESASSELDVRVARRNALARDNGGRGRGAGGRTC